MPAKKATKKTGSQKLAAKRGAKAATTGELAKAVAALKKAGIKNDILIRGIPFPDIIRGTVTAKTAAQAGSALGILLKIRDIQYKPKRLFPRGIPVIDEIVFEIDGKLNR